MANDLNPEEIPALWCRMWNEDASLAHRLLTADGRQWSGTKPGLDPLVGPADAEAFIAKYQRDVGNVFVPRTFVVDGTERLAFTWDVTRRDGVVITGADLCVLTDGKVSRNWTIPSPDGRSELPDGPGEGDLDREELRVLAKDAHAWHGELVLDPERQTIAGTWSDGSRGGIAVLVAVDGRVDREWVVPGTRPLP